MAPPSKRRRLFFWPSNEGSQEEEEESQLPQQKHQFAHTVTQIDAAPVHSPRVEEVHIQIEEQSVGQQQNLVARQAVSVDAGVSLSVSLSSPRDSETSSAVASSIAGSSTTPLDLSSSAAATSTILSASSSILVSSSQPIDNRSSTFSSSGSSTSTTSSPTITSSLLSTSSSISNITVAANVLTTALNGTVFGATLPSGNLYSSSRSNSSYTFNMPSMTSDTASSTSETSSTASESSTDNIMTSLVLTTATISRDGQAVSTITTEVGAVGYSAPPGPTSTDTTVASKGSSSSDPPPPGTIAGGVVGGAAGLAVLLLVAMLFLRWYRRRSQHAQQTLLPGSGDTYHDSDTAVSRDGPGMAERAGLRPWAAAFPALMRHQQTSPSTSSVDVAVGHERGFQRISGRKLPSAWSPGMEGPPPMPGANDARASGTSSFYPDTAANVNPFADSPEGTTPEDESLERQRSNERMTVVPGPQRRPTIHNPSRHLTVDDAQSKHMSSMARTSGTASTLLQSDTTATDSSHASQFREQV